ncbi:SsrA-binding protein [Striga asiatica]|uniref:SsrA-binding protein n=1 Tax=Striga asiatica TaxID=4170 RepID=A0A5A7PWT2_STRAF|nr:SsrA-binding protein [Striga asiatica]
MRPSVEMADVIRLCSNYQKLSSSLFSLSSSLSSCQRPPPLNQRGGSVSLSEVSSIGWGFVSPIAFPRRNQFGSPKITIALQVYSRLPAYAVEKGSSLTSFQILINYDGFSSVLKSLARLRLQFSHLQDLISKSGEA